VAGAGSGAACTALEVPAPQGRRCECAQRRVEGKHRPSEKAPSSRRPGGRGGARRPPPSLQEVLGRCSLGLGAPRLLGCGFKGLQEEEEEGVGARWVSGRSRFLFFGGGGRGREGGRQDPRQSYPTQPGPGRKVSAAMGWLPVPGYRNLSARPSATWTTAAAPPPLSHMDHCCCPFLFPPPPKKKLEAPPVEACSPPLRAGGPRTPTLKLLLRCSSNSKMAAMLPHLQAGWTGRPWLWVGLG